jgi:hypothetical protein
MLMNLVLGLGTMLVCLLLQAMLLVAAMRYYSRHRDAVNSTSYWSSLQVVSGVMLLVIGNLGQMGLWAVLFRWLGEFVAFDDASIIQR